MIVLTLFSDFEQYPLNDLTKTQALLLPLCNIQGVYLLLDFLDASDTSLAFAVFGTAQAHSFPIAVFIVSKGRKREEFLLCYNGKFSFRGDI